MDGLICLKIFFKKIPVTSFTLFIQKGVYVWEGWGKACHKFLLLGRNSIIRFTVSSVIFLNNHTDFCIDEETSRAVWFQWLFPLLNSLTFFFLVPAIYLFILLRLFCLLSFPPYLLHIFTKVTNLWAFLSGLSPLTYPKEGLECWS